MKILETGVAGSIIKLPPCEIEMPNTVITKPFILQGQPGTVLSFKYSQLILDSGAEQRDQQTSFLVSLPIIFSQIEFQFSVNMRAIAY